MSELYELPDGWEWREWKDIVNVKNGKDYKEVLNPNGLYPIYGSGGIINYSDKYLCNENSTIIGRKGTINSPIFVKEKFWNIDTAFALEANVNSLTPLFLYYFTLSFNFLTLNKSTTLPSLAKSNLQTILMPLPPLQEQQRIVSKLDLLFEKIDRSIALHQKNMDEAKAFMGSVLNDVFGELEEKYPKEKFDNIKTSNIIGLVKNVKEQSQALPYQYIKMNNITNDNRFTFHNMTNVDATDKEVEKFNLLKGDFLFNTRNSAELVGKSCIFDYKMDNVLYNNNIMRVRFRDDISSYYISYEFGSSFIKDQLENIKSATTNVAAIYYRTLKEIKVVLPPLPIQQKVVNYLDEISQKTEKIKQLQKEKMESLKALKASILDQAFRGEL